MDTSQTNVVDLSKIRARAEARAAIKELMSAVATLGAEIERLRRAFGHGK